MKIGKESTDVEMQNHHTLDIIYVSKYRNFYLQQMRIFAEDPVRFNNIHNFIFFNAEFPGIGKFAIQQKLYRTGINCEQVRGFLDTLQKKENLGLMLTARSDYSSCQISMMRLPDNKIEKQNSQQSHT